MCVYWGKEDVVEHQGFCFSCFPMTVIGVEVAPEDLWPQLSCTEDARGHLVQRLCGSPVTLERTLTLPCLPYPHCFCSSSALWEKGA